MASPTSPLASKLRGIGISQPYASQIATGARKPSLKLALQIYRKINVKIGPLAGASKAEIDALQRVSERTA